MASPNPPGNSSDFDRVLEERNQFVRTLILNRPRQLNALSSTMISRLLELLVSYEEDCDVKLIILKGKGRAFCAGGDVPALVHDSEAGKWRSGAEFFRLNYLIATYSKPHVSILNGITMGGGVGVSVHGRFRVATENTVFALPETAFGLFPDFGSSYFIARLPGFFGEYIGLTGARLDGAEMLACGLATHFVNSKKLSKLEEALCKQSANDLGNISAIIDIYAQKPEVKEKSAFMQLDIIDRCFSLRIVEEIISSLIREGRLQGVGQCLIREYRMIGNVMKAHISRDFFEGGRTLLTDKDKTPKWKPSSLDQVSDSILDCYFSELKVERWEDLKPPLRPTSLPASAIAKL